MDHGRGGTGEANPAYETTMTSTVITEAAGATMLVPNAVTRAEPTIPLPQTPRSRAGAYPIRRNPAACS